MTRLPGLDPEVLADLRAREQSVDDRARHRRVRNPWVDAAHWPCAKGCGAMVGITQEAVTALAILNGQLAANRQRPIAKMEAVPCANCKRADDAAEQARRRPHEQRTIAGLGPGGKGRP